MDLYGRANNGYLPPRVYPGPATNILREQGVLFLSVRSFDSRSFNTGPLVEPILTGRPTSNAPI